MSFLCSVNLAESDNFRHLYIKGPTVYAAVHESCATGVAPQKTSGEIYLDGEVVANCNREHYRQHFSVIFSDFYLFRQLLGLGHNDLEEQARAGIKRLALLVALLEEDRPNYLFGEWVAEDDTASRELFYLELLPELKARGKTVIVISHDDRYFHVADRFIKMDYGKIEPDQLAHRAHENQSEIPLMINRGLP